MTDLAWELAAKEAIRDAVLRYCRGVDRADPELIASAYHPDAVDQHGSAHFEGAAIGPGIVALVQASRVSLHQVTNQTIVFHEPDRAASETYYTAWQSMERDGVERMLVAIGRYVDRFTHRGGEWRIADRLVIVEHAQLLPADAVLPTSTPGLSCRDRSDPSYGALGT